MAALIPKPPPPAGAAGPPNVKGDGVVLPNTELLVPLLAVWVVAPKPEVVAAPKEKAAVVYCQRLAGCWQGCQRQRPWPSDR